MKLGSVDEVAVVCRWTGFPLTDAGISRFEQLEAWLKEEAIVAGGLGPNEVRRIWGRHLADSATFAVGWRGQNPPGELVDVGAGVGLPGLVLAVLWPTTAVTLLDRSGRRSWLARRAVRILGLPNVEVVEEEAQEMRSGWEAMVMRAALKPRHAADLAARVLASGGKAVVGWKRREAQGEAQPSITAHGREKGLEVEAVLVPSEVVDGGSYLLMMSKT